MEILEGRIGSDVPPAFACHPFRPAWYVRGVVWLCAWMTRLRRDRY